MKKTIGENGNRKWLKLLCVSLIINFHFSTFNSLQAQTGRVTVTGDVAVNEMVARHVELNNRTKTMPGYRVQIASFSGINSKNSAFSLRERFMTDYPAVQAYIIYDEPNFKVKVGDFRSRLEAYAFLQEIKEVYKGYIIKDNIYAEPPTLEDYAPDDLESGEE
ncbi:MAG: SPOR domain-containing protein [Bacteroidales bacterium]|nr:SPOR domain-containing protein [Bacteroidales bacterium]